MKSENPRIPLPKSWSTHVRWAILHVISLAQFATAHTRSWAANSVNARIRLKAERDRAVQELGLLREETRIKDARMVSINPHRRPHYPPAERLAILELKAARGWSLEQTARVFHVTAPTIASWLGRLDEEGPDAMVQMRTPVNRFPDFVRYAVQRLKTLCPTMGKVKIAQTLARAGLHLGATTVGRILLEDATPKQMMKIESPQHWCKESIQKLAPWVWLMQSVVSLWYLTDGRKTPEAKAARRRMGEWDTECSLAHMLRILRRTTLRAIINCNSPTRADQQQLIDDLENYLSLAI